MFASTERSEGLLADGHGRDPSSLQTIQVSVRTPDDGTALFDRIGTWTVTLRMYVRRISTYGSVEGLSFVTYS